MRSVVLLALLMAPAAFGIVQWSEDCCKALMGNDYKCYDQVNKFYLDCLAEHGTCADQDNSQGEHRKSNDFSSFDSGFETQKGQRCLAEAIQDHTCLAELTAATYHNPCSVIPVDHPGLYCYDATGRCSEEASKKSEQCIEDDESNRMEELEESVGQYERKREQQRQQLGQCIAGQCADECNCMRSFDLDTLKCMGTDKNREFELNSIDCDSHCLKHTQQLANLYKTTLRQWNRMSTRPILRAAQSRLKYNHNMKKQHHANLRHRIHF